MTTVGSSEHSLANSNRTPHASNDSVNSAVVIDATENDVQSTLSNTSNSPSQAPSTVSEVAISMRDVPSSVCTDLNQLQIAAKKSLEQSKNFHPDMDRLIEAIRFFDGTCAMGGYPSGTIETNLELIITLEDRYDAKNSNSEWIQSRVNVLRDSIKHSADPTTTVREKRGLGRYFTNVNNEKTAVNSGFDTEKTARAIGDILIEGNDQKSQLVEELLSDLVASFRSSDNLFKRLPFIKTDIAREEYTQAAALLADTLPLFISTKVDFENNQSKKHLAGLEEYIDCAKVIAQHNEDAASTLHDAIQELTDSLSKTLLKKVLKLEV